MDRILLLIDHKKNREILEGRLADGHSVLPRSDDGGLDEMFDLGILDGPALDRLGDRVAARREVESPAFLPFLLVTPRRDVGLATRHLWRSIDDVFHAPVVPLELQARVEVLLRARRQSLVLRNRGEALEALIHALAHEIRAPLRAIGEFTGHLQADYAGRLGERGEHYLDRVRLNAEQLRRLIESMTDYFRMGHEPAELRLVRLRPILESCASHFRDEVEVRRGEVVIEGPSTLARADPKLLKVVVRNLLANALKYVAPGVRPRVTLAVEVPDGRVRISVVDNGIGVAPGDRIRIFEPFVRLHSEEEYPGIGLGLASVRRAVNAMGGRLGVESGPGGGSRFWVELERGETP